MACHSPEMSVTFTFIIMHPKYCVDMIFMMRMYNFSVLRSYVNVFVSANRETHKAEIIRLKQIIADLESAGTKHASGVR